MKILFVDDAPEIITSLQRMMKQAPWKVSFAGGGMEALEMLEESEFDVIVTDLNMPEVNGVKLLKIIQKEYPHLIRIIYSGNLTKDSVREVASFTHRFISKPCTVEKMMQTIENTLFIHTVLNNDKIKKVLTNTGSLPSLPRIYSELTTRIENPDFSLKDASKLIASDIGMSANILKQINLLGRGSEVQSIEQAVTMLGLDTIKAIVLASHVFSEIPPLKITHFSPDQLVRHSMLTAHFAQEITLIETDDPKKAEAAYAAGVLHDLGILLLAVNFPELYSDVLQRVYKANRPIADVERNLIGISHGEIGAYLLALWGFPREILTASAFHEDPLNHPVESFELLTAVFVGSYLAHLFEKDRPCPENYLEEHPYLQQLNCSGRYQFWTDRCRQIYDSLPAK